MNRQTVTVGIAVLALVAIGLFAWKQGQRPAGDGETHATPYEQMSAFATIKSDREVIVHCGNSMRVAMERIAAEFQRRSGIAVVFNFGGGSELLPLIEMGNRGDLYLCHDPYADILKEKNLLADYTLIGHLEPVILMPKGNPKQLTGLEDLARPNLRVAATDPRFNTAAKLLHRVLDREPWGNALRENIVIETRGHSDAVLSVLTGHADAAVVWSFLGALYRDKLDTIPCGVEFDQKTRVTLCRLTTSENTETTAALLDFAVSDYAQKVWEYYGYRTAN